MEVRANFLAQRTLLAEKRKIGIHVTRDWMDPGDDLGAQRRERYCSPPRIDAFVSGSACGIFTILTEVQHGNRGSSVINMKLQ
jgi:hypothetical protein